jgi:hypothetical protein
MELGYILPPSCGYNVSSFIHRNSPLGGRAESSIFEDVMQRIVREAAIQQLQEDLNFDRQTATDTTEEILQELADWRSLNCDPAASAVSAACQRRHCSK